MRVLVVEDEKKTASFVRKAFQAEGFAAEVCYNGRHHRRLPMVPGGFKILAYGLKKYSAICRTWLLQPKAEANDETVIHP